MAINTTPTKWSMYNPQQLDRVNYSRFQGSGIDTFTDPTAQDPTKFLQLTNVLPAITGGFDRRWGINTTGNVFSGNVCQRLFSYAASTDTTFSGSADCSIILATDNTKIEIVFNELGSTPSFNIPNFSGSGVVYGTTSREYFYVMDGVGIPQKVDYSQRVTNTAWQWGIETPNFYNGPATGGLYTPLQSYGLGSNFTAPTATLTGGGGTGATFVLAVQNGLIVSAVLTNRGTGYTDSPTVTITDSTGTLDPNVSFSFFPDTDTTSSTNGQLLSWTINGPFVLNAGRIYAIAYKNSVTGHTGNYIYSNLSAHNFVVDNLAGTLAIASFLGGSRLVTTIGVEFLPTDPQIDTLVILASSDGGDAEHLYELAQLPISSLVFNGSTSFYEYTINDALPDTYNDNYTEGPTLLTKNLWVDVDQYGNPIGIFDNTPPQTTLNKPILHKNRFFATDGKSVYFSKSLAEVTTSTGLITSKFEEAWPGDNVLDIAYGNEHIVGLLSDGYVLYIGTTENIYRLFGSSVQDFDIPATIFRGVGVYSQDVWSVVYKDNVPAGYMWTTPDNKIMFSDFNTYIEVGSYISNNLTATGQLVKSVQSVSYAAYSLVFFGINNPTGLQLPAWYIYDSKTGGWYFWEHSVTNEVANYPSTLLNYTNASGIETIYMVKQDEAASQYLNLFNPTAIFDGSFGTMPSTLIPWTIQTSWQDLGDSTATKVLNEIELWTMDPGTHVTVYAARQPSDFPALNVLKTGSFTIGPLGTQKFYLAGSNSRGRYYSFQFGTPTATSSAKQVLQAFSVEFFPMGRI